MDARNSIMYQYLKLFGVLLNFQQVDWVPSMDPGSHDTLKYSFSAGGKGDMYMEQFFHDCVEAVAKIEGQQMPQKEINSSPRNQQNILP